jgi:hypothetical protein
MDHRQDARRLARLMGWYYLVTWHLATAAHPLLRVDHRQQDRQVAGQGGRRPRDDHRGDAAAGGRAGRGRAGGGGLAPGNAVALTAVDVVYVAKRRIRPVYLLDAVLEIALLAGWFRLARQWIDRDGRRRADAANAG